jgi:hypothetical protein
VSIFPWYIAAAKILFYGIIVFLVVPLIFHSNADKVTPKKVCPVNTSQNSTQKMGVLGNILLFLKTFVYNFIFIITKTLPLMIIGGII